ncbi:hypothetical protein [Candidatus Chlorohelix sp.]|uniref:hypothetical protein n=1 Tax=Candidatus Chlorohelix sp. TaxID=3139201 RepID=UPI00304F3E83
MTMQDFVFEIGKQYRNRRGIYTVISINQPKMLVSYEDGTTAELTIEQQANIVRNMLNEDWARQTQEQAELIKAAKARPTRVPKTDSKAKASATPKAQTPKPEKEPKPQRENVAARRSAQASEVPALHRTLLANDPNDQLFRADEIRIFSQFRGYGNQNAPIWFLGMEEQSEFGALELKHRLAMEIYEERFADLQARYRLEKIPVSYHFATPEHKIMAFVGVRFNGEGLYPNGEKLEEYFAASFGTSVGNVLISDLLPLPAGNEWLYTNIRISDNSMLQYHLRDRKLYTQMFLPERISLFQDMYESLKAKNEAPRYIFCYGGRKHWTHYRKIFPLSYVEISLEMRTGGPDSTLMLGRDNDSGTWVILAGAFSDSRGDVTNHLCDQLAQRLEQL